MEVLVRSYSAEFQLAVIRSRLSGAKYQTAPAEQELSLRDIVQRNIMRHIKTSFFLEAELLIFATLLHHIHRQTALSLDNPLILPVSLAVIALVK